MKKTLYKIIFRVIKKRFIVLLTNIANAINHRKCVSVRNQKC